MFLMVLAVWVLAELVGVWARLSRRRWTTEAVVITPTRATEAESPVGVGIVSKNWLDLAMAE